VFGAQKNKEEFLMTNTSFRKKALLSSVAMMLVALIALGSATFAWFATTPNASANGLNMTTSASTGIKVLSDSERTIWIAEGNAAGTTALANKYAKSGIFLDAEKKSAWLDDVADPATDNSATRVHSNLQTKASGHNISELIIPLSSSTDLTAADQWYTNTGLDENTGTAQDAWSSTKTLTVDTNCYKEDIWLMADGTGGSQTVRSATVSWTGSEDISPAIRVMLLNSAGALLGVWAPETTTHVAAAVNCITSGAPATISSNVGYNGQPIALASTVTASDSEGTATSKVTVVVYIDGQDTLATSAKAALSTSEILTNLTVDLSTATVS
jgi:hypothetical protein